MGKLFACTVEYCEVEGFICYMNEYEIDKSHALKEQCKVFADKDIAPYVEVFEEGKDKVIATFEYPEHKCKCEQHN